MGTMSSQLNARLSISCMGNTASCLYNMTACHMLWTWILEIQIPRPSPRIWRTWVGVAAGATRSALTYHFACAGNAGDISAKEGSQVRFSLAWFPMLLIHDSQIDQVFSGGLNSASKAPPYCIKVDKAVGPCNPFKIERFVLVCPLA